VATADVTIHARSLSSEKYILCVATTVAWEVLSPQVCVCGVVPLCVLYALSVCHTTCVDPMTQSMTPFVSAIMLNAFADAVFVLLAY
jgi:hypothetical protein